MPTIKKVLQNKLANAKRIAVLGIGSDLRGDDAAGMLAAEDIAKYITKKPKSRIKVFFGSTAPENLTGEVRKFKPTHLLIIDTVEIKEKPGTILVLTPEEVGDGVSFSTHKMPAKILAEYFLRLLGCNIIFVGIQPSSIEFGRPPSKQVKSAAREIASAIRDIIYAK